MMELDTWVQAVVGVLVSGSIAGVVQLSREIHRRQASGKYDRGFSNIYRTFSLIQKLLSDTAANRVLILKSENGGGIPAPGAPVKSSVLSEVCDSSCDPIQNQWQMVPLDQDYSRVLAEVNTKGSAIAVQADLHCAMVLRDLLKAGDASHACMYRICATPHALLYLSVQYSSPDDEDPMAAADRVAVRSTLRELCEIFSKHHYLVKRETK